MQIFRDYRHWPDALKGGVVVIGNFDGLHRGHIAVLEQAREKAKTLNAPFVVLTFEPHPRRLFQPDSPELRLMSFADKARTLKALGVDAILAQRFNRAFSQLDAPAFMQQVLVDALGAQSVLTGEDFIFGHQRSGHAESLMQFSKAQQAFSYLPISPVGNQDEGKFSSSKIREHLRQGEMRHVCAMLGRPYRWCRTVIHGDARGRTIGFPTANMLPPPLLLPRYGVYAVRGQWEGMAQAQGVANLGVRPSVDGERCLLEVHWFDVDADLYGQELCVEFIEHLRDEQHFDGIEALKDQIAQDCAQAKDALHS